MSSHSRIKRGAGKRNAGKVAAKREIPPHIEPHAELRDPDGALLAGIVRRDGEWVLGMDGRIAGHSSSAAHVFAMIRRAAALHESQGTSVKLTCSDALKDAALLEAAGQGISFEQFEAQLKAAMEGSQG